MFDIINKISLFLPGLNDVASDHIVFHAGTKAGEGDKTLTSGGRVLAVVAVKPSIVAAIDSARTGVQAIHFDDMFYRKDIGQKALIE